TMRRRPHQWRFFAAMSLWTTAACHPGLAPESHRQLATGADRLWLAGASMATGRRTHTATLLPTGAVLISGGQDGAAVLSSAELYLPWVNAWTPAAPMSTPRWIATATLLLTGKVLVAGGA